MPPHLRSRPGWTRTIDLILIRDAPYPPELQAPGATPRPRLGPQPQARIEPCPLDPQPGPFLEGQGDEAPLPGEGLHEHPVRFSLVATADEGADRYSRRRAGSSRSPSQVRRHVQAPADQAIA